ncbi:VCBS repeat-containing protein, partial [Candidatus Poribacteria bacterium]|nr:VCBS repeat-containing protein [Candidatus Poribacteria bacterium]
MSRWWTRLAAVALGLAVASAALAAQFARVTEAAGINFKHHNGSSGGRLFVEPLGSGVGVLDYDRDGFQDIYFVDGADLPGATSDTPPRNALYRNNGDGTFTDVTHAAGVGDTGYGMGCAIGDVDNDGFQDIYVTNFGPNVLYRNLGDGTFADATETAGVGDARWGASCAFADIDGDGFLDLFVTNYVRYSVETDKVCENQGIRSYCDPRLYEGEGDILYHNNGDGSFTDSTVASGLSAATRRGLAVVFGDYDGDGDADLYVANDADPNLLYENDGAGTFDEVGLLAGVGFSEDGETENGMGADFGDYDNDGDLDLVVTNFHGQTNTLYRNEGAGLFMDVSYASRTGAASLPHLAWGAVFLDHDNDGRQDVFVANGHLHDRIAMLDGTQRYEQRNLLYHNVGGGVFEEIGSAAGDGLAVEKSSRGVAYVDYDNDGDLDLIVTNLADAPDLLRNDRAHGAWLRVELVGSRSSRDAIGGRVRVDVGAM